MDADEVQIDGSANVTMIIKNLVIGRTSDLKGTITSCKTDVWVNWMEKLKLVAR